MQRVIYYRDSQAPLITGRRNKVRLPKTTSEYDGDWLRKFNELQNDAQHNGGYLVEVEPIEAHWGSAGFNSAHQFDNCAPCHSPESTINSELTEKLNNGLRWPDGLQNY